MSTYLPPAVRSKFKRLVAALSAVMVLPALFATAQTSEDGPLEMPVSINAIMVTLVDHAAHHIWDYGAMQRQITDDEWRIIEYYAIQLAAAGPALTLGGTGELDEIWSKAPAWKEHARNMSSVAREAIVAAQDQDLAMLRRVGNDLTDSCEACHSAFKPDLPTEGIDHNPDYDLLYHIFNNWRTEQ
jgi:hypothetical protein